MVLTLDETIDFHKNSVEEKGTRFHALDKAIRNDLTTNKSK